MEKGRVTIVNQKMERLSGPSLGTMCQLWQFPKNLVYWTSQARHRVTDCESQVPRKQETSRRRFQKGSTFRRRSLWCTPRLTQCRGGTTCGRAHRKTPDDLRVSSEVESGELRGKVPETKHKQANWQVPCGCTVPLTNPNCEVSKHTKTTGAPCRNRPEACGDRIHHPRKFCDGITADLKVLNAENESRLLLRYAVVMQRLCSYCIQCHPTKNKNRKKR